MVLAQIVGYLKGKSSLMIFDKFANLKYKYGNRHFWCKGYYVSTVGRNEKKITEYIQNQLQEDIRILLAFEILVQKLYGTCIHIYNVLNLFRPWILL